MWVSVHVCGHSQFTVNMFISEGKLWWSVLYLCGFWGWNLGPQVWWQLPVPPKPFFLPICIYFWVLLIRPRRASGSCIFHVSLPSVSSLLNNNVSPWSLRTAGVGWLVLPRLALLHVCCMYTCMLHICWPLSSWELPCCLSLGRSDAEFPLKRHLFIKCEPFFLLAGSRCGWKWQRRRGESWLGKLVPVSPQMTHLRFSKSLRFLVPERICETQSDYPIKSF